MTDSRRKQDADIWLVERKYLTGQPLSADDIRIAETALLSSIFGEKVVACEALLRSECAPNLKQRSLIVLKDLCNSALRGGGEFQTTLILAVLALPKDELLLNEVFKRFAYKIASAGDSGSRMNNMLLLERFARHGDANAIQFLQDALDDPDDLVQRNARFCTERLQAADST